MEFKIFWKRVKFATDIRNQAELAKVLRVSQPAISDAKKRNLASDRWLMSLYWSHNLSPVWLADGVGTPHVKDTKAGHVAEAKPEYGFAVINTDMMACIIEELEEYCKNEKYFPTAENKARIICMKYYFLKEGSDLPIKSVVKYVEATTSPKDK